MHCLVREEDDSIPLAVNNFLGWGGGGTAHIRARDHHVK
jgi:hypothetical protein